MRKATRFIPRALLLAGLTLFLNYADISAQPIAREWVRNYFNIQTKTNQSASIAIASDGGVIVAGTSQNDAGDLDYQVLKYKPNGDEAWRNRYGSANAGNDQLRGMAIDGNGNIFLTGSSETVKFTGGGTFAWAVPLSGRAIVADTGYVYVTGFSDTDIATVQLDNLDGHELWRRFVDGQAHGVDIGQAITLDSSGNVFVGGQLDDRGCQKATCYFGPGVVSYTPGGVERWVGRTDSVWPTADVLASSVMVHPDGAVYVYGSYDPSQGTTAFLAKFDENGTYQWNYNTFSSFGTKLIIDQTTGNIVATGRYKTEGTMVPQAAVVDVFTNNTLNYGQIWQYLGPNGGRTEGSDMRQDSQGNLYVVGYSANDAVSKAMLLAKITPTGRQIGLDRYNSPNAGSNLGTALAIDANNNVYVTGYVQNTQGGSEFVTIKYPAAPKINEKPNGTMHLEFHTSPGQQYSIEATSDLFNWQSLITNTADANGLIQFDDTNAPTIPYRFYRGNTTP